MLVLMSMSIVDGSWAIDKGCNVVDETFLIHIQAVVV